VPQDILQRAIKPSCLGDERMPSRCCVFFLDTSQVYANGAKRLDGEIILQRACRAWPSSRPKLTERIGSRQTLVQLAFHGMALHRMKCSAFPTPKGLLALTEPGARVSSSP
jgi:hypothetical protein